MIDESCSDTATDTFINLNKATNKQAGNDAYLPAKVKKCGTLRMRSETSFSENRGKYVLREKKHLPKPCGVATMIGENRPLH